MSGPRISQRGYLAQPQGAAWIVVDPHGVRVSGPFARSVARHEAHRLTVEAAAREKRGPRPCIRCGQEFNSEGIGNRMCGPCRAHGIDYLCAYGIVGGLSGSGKRSGVRGGRG